VLSLRSPADLVLKRNAEGGYDAVVAGAPDSNALTLRR